MKRGKILIVALVGLLMVSGLVFVGCNDKSKCPEDGKCYYNQLTGAQRSCSDNRCSINASWDATRCDC